MAQSAGRLTCPRCGANNFDTVTTCWKCSAPLHGNALPPPSAPTYAAPSPGGNIAFARPEQSSPAYAPTYAPAAMPDGDVGVARRAAILLALTLPYVGIPVGWIFMMVEDRRRQTIGRFCVVWSTVSLVFHLLLMFALAQSLGPYLSAIVNASAKAAGAAGRTSGGGGGEPTGNGAGGAEQP